MNVQELIAKVQELDAKATKGPWARWQDHNSVHAQVSAQDACLIRSGGEVCDCGEDDDEWDDATSCKHHRTADADFIAHSRTLLPLCARLLEIYGTYCIRGQGFIRNTRELYAELDAALSDAKERVQG